jgi:hypothetical protein
MVAPKTFVLIDVRSALLLLIDCSRTTIGAARRLQTIPILDSAHMYVYHASKGPITCINLGSKTSEAGGEWEDREGNIESGLYINQCAEQLAISKRQIGHSHERGKLCL